MEKQEYDREYYQSNKERIKLRTNTYYHSHKTERSLYAKKYYQKRKPEIASKIRGWNLKNRYGISEEEYSMLFDEQQGKCAICKQVSTKKRLCVDHDHETGKVRKLLCDRCNKVIGAVEENQIMLTEMAKYLEAHNARVQV